MNLYIEHYPKKNFAMFSFTPVFSVDINESVKKKLKKDEQLTNAIAFKIFKQIKWESDVLSFLTKPIFLIPLSCCVLTIASLCIRRTGALLSAILVIVGALSSGLLGYSIENSFNGFLFKLSQAYSAQSERAREYIKFIEKNNEKEISISLVPEVFTLNLR